MLPLLTSGVEGTDAVEYATYIYHELAIPEDVRGGIAKSLLRASILPLHVYRITKQKTPAYPYSSQPQPPEEPKQLERLKPFVKACFDLDAPELFALVSAKLVDFAGASRDVLDRRVRHVILPLIAYARPLGACTRSL